MKPRKQREYGIWVGMRARCNNPMATGYQNYGGRGIKVCDRWSSFAVFIADMGSCPAGMSIERNDNNRDYEPGNCRWATKVAQENNKRLKLFDEPKGTTKTGIRGIGFENNRWRVWVKRKEYATFPTLLDACAYLLSPHGVKL